MKLINKKPSLLNIFTLTLPFYFLLAACSGPQPKNDTPDNDLSQNNTSQINTPQIAITTIDGNQQADNILLLVDNSNSLNATITTDSQDIPKFELERQLLARINRLLPNHQLNVGLRKFGYGSCLNWKHTERLLEIQPHSKLQFTEALGNLKCAGGGSPADIAFKTAGKDDLVQTVDNKAIIFISDGNYNLSTTTKALQLLQDQYQQQVCVFPIWTGNSNDLEGLEKMQQINRTMCCGFLEQAQNLDTDSALTSYLEKIVNNFTADIDNDCDGVTDATPDQCPNTPPNTVVDKIGCIADNDHDGVLNNADRCPLTPEGTRVDKFGCWDIPAIEFATDKYNITANYIPVINKVALTLLKHPQLSLSITGHTDNVFTYPYNKVLAKNRANAVKAFFRKKGISSKRIKISAKADRKPIASNKTAAGRQKNRRAKLKLIYPVTKDQK